MMNAEEKEYMDYLIHNRTELTKQITNHLNELEQLQKKLDIAIKTLKEYANRDNWNHCETENGWKLWFRAMFGTDHFGYRKAENTLKEINEALE